VTKPHGTYARAKSGCTCTPCKDASRRYNKRRELLIATGRWQPFVDAEPVRAHVRRLGEYGIGWKSLAQAAGVPRGVMWRLLYGDRDRGPSKRVRAATAEAILAVQPTLDILPDGARVDGAGTRRRLQALIALGYSQARLASLLGFSKRGIGDLLSSDSRVEAGTARAVRTLYSRLWDQPPPEQTPPQHRAASRARAYARRQGWPPPTGWDDDLIDLPDDELEAVLRRRAKAMDNNEVARCYRAHRNGDLSLLVAAGAREYQRRRTRSRKEGAA